MILNIGVLPGKTSPFFIHYIFPAFVTTYQRHAEGRTEKHSSNARKRNKERTKSPCIDSRKFSIIYIGSPLAIPYPNCSTNKKEKFGVSGDLDTEKRWQKGYLAYVGRWDYKWLARDGLVQWVWDYLEWDIKLRDIARKVLSISCEIPAPAYGIRVLNIRFN